MNALKLAMQILGMLPQLVQTAEQAFSGKAGSGASKKQLVMDTVQAAITIAETADVKIPDLQKEAIVAGSSSLVDSIVANVNAFQEKKPEPVTASVQAQS